MTARAARPGTRRPRVGRGGRTRPRRNSTGSESEPEATRNGTRKWNSVPTRGAHSRNSSANQRGGVSLAERFRLFAEIADFRAILQQVMWRREWDSLNRIRETPMNTGFSCLTRGRSAIWRLRIVSSAFVRWLLFSGFASAMTLEMSLAGVHFADTLRGRPPFRPFARAAAAFLTLRRRPSSAPSPTKPTSSSDRRP